MTQQINNEIVMIVMCFCCRIFSENNKIAQQNKIFLCDITDMPHNPKHVLP